MSYEQEGIHEEILNEESGNEPNEETNESNDEKSGNEP